MQTLIQQICMHVLPLLLFSMAWALAVANTSILYSATVRLLPLRIGMQICVSSQRLPESPVLDPQEWQLQIPNACNL